MDAGPERDRPVPARAEHAAAARVRARGGWAVPRAPRFGRPRWLLGAARPFRSIAEVLLFVLTGLPLGWFRRRKRVLVSLGLGAAGLIAVVFLAPLAWAGRLDPCAAAEVALVDEAVGRGSRFEASKRRVANWAGPDGKLFSHGRVGRQIAVEEHAGWPPLLGCTALFWRVRSEDAALDGVRLLRFAAVLARR